MSDNIEKDDIASVINFLSQPSVPKLTNGRMVEDFEKAWSEWLGVKYSIFVNSGSSANELTMLALKYLTHGGKIIVPPLTWVSDIASVIQNGFIPVFCDINLKNLSFDIEKLKALITPDVKAIFVTHILGQNALTNELLEICKKNSILLIEDVCESHGATFKGKKCGTFGIISNFSFYFAHHMSTIEGGMISTDNPFLYQLCRMFRSHGMLRESNDPELIYEVRAKYPNLNQDFIFLYPAHNHRSTEINAVLGLSQLKKLDSVIATRRANFEYFLSKLNKEKYFTEFDLEGQSNYAFILVLKNPKYTTRNKIEYELAINGIEFRRGLSGGGNQLLQPYIKENFLVNHNQFPVINHIHDFSWYIGNYPSLEKDKIDKLVEILNNI